VTAKKGMMATRETAQEAIVSPKKERWPPSRFHVTKPFLQHFGGSKGGHDVPLLRR
jgi:hypothetical protein